MWFVMQPPAGVRLALVWLQIRMSEGQEGSSLGASAGTEGTGSDGAAAGLPACGADGGGGAMGGNPAFGGAFGGSGVLRKDGGAGGPGYGTIGALGCSNGAAGATVHRGQPRVRCTCLLICRK